MHVASTWQDGVARKAERVEDQKLKWTWVESMERMGKLSKEDLKALGRFKL